MVYWLGVTASSKKDVSGSEYITRNGYLQGVLRVLAREWLSFAKYFRMQKQKTIFEQSSRNIGFFAKLSFE
jgi:hypothetical protein